MFKVLSMMRLCSNCGTFDSGILAILAACVVALMLHFMFDLTGRAPMLPGNGVPVALENDEQTPEEAEQALTEALTARIASLDAQLAKLGILGQ